MGNRIAVTVRRNWSLVTAIVDTIVVLFITGLACWGVYLLVNSTKAIEEEVSLLVGLSGLVISLVAIFMGTIRPTLRKPHLSYYVDRQWSEPTINGDLGSWFYRLKIENYGLSKASNCSGRLLGVWDSNGKQLSKFDPLLLYWSRQGNHNVEVGETVAYKPITIQGFGDFDFLDLVQIKKNSLVFRLVIPQNMPLKIGEPTSISPGNQPKIIMPNSFFIQVGVFADKTEISPTLFEFTCSEASFPARRDLFRLRLESGESSTCKNK